MTDETTAAGVGGEPPAAVHDTTVPDVPDGPEDERVNETASAGGTDSTVTTMDPPLPNLPAHADLKDVLQTGEHEELKGDVPVVWGGRYALRVQRSDGHWLCVGWNGVPHHRSDEQLTAEYARGPKKSSEPEPQPL